MGAVSPRTEVTWVDLFNLIEALDAHGVAKREDNRNRSPNHVKQIE